MARRCIDIELGGNLITSSILTNLDDLPLNVPSGYELFHQRAVPSFITSYGYVVGDVNLQNYEYYSSDNRIRLKGERDGNDGAVSCTVYNNGGEYFTCTYFRLNVAYYTPTAWACWVVDDDAQVGWVIRITKLPSFLGDEYIVWCYGGDTITYNALHSAVPVTPITSNGGGATHIAKVTGQLSSLSNNLSDILMVSGGGGGGLIVGETDYSGKEAGGISGSGDNSADQSTGYAFGQGESADGVSGGGSGLYGGYKGTSSKSGGAGSGYIGNSLVSNKKMVGYNVPTSSAESTKTESVEDASENPVSGKPKIGNGYAKIKFLRSCWGGEEVAILWAGDSNKMTVQISNSDILFKLYTGDIAIYSFTAYAGSTVLDADNIFVHFLIESEQQLAKPSMVYANGSVLSYNQEEPTDAEMADIYTWLSAGLPSA